MVPVFTTANMIEAGLIRGLLQSQGIPATTSGEFLAGALGELPADVIKVLVEEEHATTAQDIINDYLQAEPVFEPTVSGKD